MALVFVTGARGAIGRHVVAQVSARGDAVAGLGHGDWASDLPPVDFWLNGDVSTGNLALLSAKAGQPDIVVHLAGGSSVGPSVANPAEDYRRTVTGGHSVLEWMRLSAPGARLVIASSAAVYGDGHSAPISEDAPFNPTSPYGAHKAMTEIMAKAYAGQYGLNVAVLRLFSVYGPGLRKQLVWEVFRRLLRGERNLTFDGSGGEKRDFVAIGEAASLLLKTAGLAGPACPVFNGGSGRATSVRALAEAMTALVPADSIRFSGQVRKGDPAYLVSDQRAAEQAGLTATASLEAGLAETLDWVRRDSAGVK